jgi:hypothetical protein
MAGLTDKLNVVQVLPPVANAFAGTVNSTYLNMEDYEGAIFVVYWGVGATGTSTITLNQATDSSGTGATAIPFNYRNVSNTASSDVPGARTAATSAGFTTTAGSNQLYLIEVETRELGAGGNWVSLQSVEVVASARLGGIYAVMGEPRYLGATAQTALT